MVCLADANARPPTCDYVHAGDHGVHKASPYTPFLRDLLVSGSLFLPSTFSKNVLHGRDPGTYFWNPDQAPLTIDHLMLAKDVEAVEQS
eukprot:3388909-Karenia_brevis.AAC.1